MQKTIKKTTTLLLVFALLLTLIPVSNADAKSVGTRMSALEARNTVTNRFGGIIQKIEYNYDDHDPLYKREAYRPGRKLTFELNARTGRFEKYEIDGSNDWYEFSRALRYLKTMNQVSASVIKKSGRSNTFVSKIEFKWDDSKPMYQGEAFYQNTKISFEVNVYTARFYKFEVDRGDDTYYEEYFNVRPDGK